MKKILIVDDNHAIRELYSYIFTDLGYEVRTADNGRDALEKLPGFTPDCMVIDITMPEMTGAELARELSRSPAPGWKNIPFVIMTGESCMDITSNYDFRENRSCKAVLHKMTSPDNIARTVQDILAGRS